MSENMQIHPAHGVWVARADGAVIAESTAALELTIGDRPPLILFPRHDVAMAFLEPSDSEATSPHIGRRRYMNIAGSGITLFDAAWFFDAPGLITERLADHLAFDTERVAVERL